VTIFHIAHAVDWHDAERAGEYRVSTRGRTLDQVGFIHCSTAEQVETTADAFYSDDPLALIVLELDSEAIEAAGIAVRWEDAGAGQLFPHVYGPLKPEFVVSVTPLIRG
jgi:uncharacterized protein (DUF952 family)